MFNDEMRKPVGRRPSTEGRATFALCLGAAGMLCAFGLSVTWARLSVVDRAYELGRDRARNEQLLRERAKLNLEIEALQTARKVDSAAHALGLVKAERVVVVGSERVASMGGRVDGVLASNGM